MHNYRYRGVRKKRGEVESRALARLTFRIDSKHLRELDDYANSQGMTNSFLLRHLVIRFLETQRKQAAFPTNGEAP
ncbi:MAG: hypothetical protein WDA20_05140 [Desulfuromonadales bacterium]